MALITFTTDTISLSIPVKKVSWPSTALDTQQLISVRLIISIHPAETSAPAQTNLLSVTENIDSCATADRMSLYQKSGAKQREQ